MTARRVALAALGAALATCAAAPARAGVLTREALGRWFPEPYVVGEREGDVPAWPIFRRQGPPSFALDLAGYAFESVDLAPIPGFAGTPVNLLVAVDPEGTFLDVRVLSQHEPVFVGGVGAAPLERFVTQYRGLSLRQSIRIGGGRDAAPGGAQPHVDGIARATASVRIVNQSVLGAALRVARARLGFSGADPDRVARVREDRFEPRTWPQLVADGLVRSLVLRNRDVERAFAGGEGAGLDPDALARPGDLFLELHAALATVPTAGRNLLDERAWSMLRARIDPGDHVLLVMSRGREGLAGDGFVRGAVPDRLSLSQGGIGIELRDLDLEGALRPIGQPPLDDWKAFRVIAQAGLDPGAPMDLSFRVTREKGAIHPERIGREFALAVAVPAGHLAPAAPDPRSWTAAWRERRGTLTVLVLALALLAVALAGEVPPVARARPLRWFRPAFLAFTLVWVGWYAQAQLSIVNLVAAAEALRAGRSLAFVLHDPPSALLWGFVLVSLVAWGRGTFCGWLCPFGALQELTGLAARRAGAPVLRVGARADRALLRAKYVLLAAIVAATVAGPRWSDRAVELEPFKTAITLGFARPWPFVAWAAALVALAAVATRPFCRYACPLGAVLALAGRVRSHRWIPRRAECGAPCQTCRHRCEYRAIDAAGRVDHAECFQCLDCVAVFHSDDLCAPRLLERIGRPIPASRRTGGGA